MGKKEKWICILYHIKTWKWFLIDLKNSCLQMDLLTGGWNNWQSYGEITGYTFFVLSSNVVWKEKNSTTSYNQELASGKFLCDLTLEYIANSSLGLKILFRDSFERYIGKKSSKVLFWGPYVSTLGPNVLTWCSKYWVEA